MFIFLLIVSTIYISSLLKTRCSKCLYKFCCLGLISLPALTYQSVGTLAHFSLYPSTNAMPLLTKNTLTNPCPLFINSRAQCSTLLVRNDPTCFSSGYTYNKVTKSYVGHQHTQSSSFQA